MPTTRGDGHRPATRPSSGTSRTPTKAACTCPSSSSGRATSPMPADGGTSSTTSPTSSPPSTTAWASSCPTTYRGYEQIPLAGTSLRYSFDDADAADARNVQYFEMMGHRAIYADGWKAVTRHTSGRALRGRRLGAVPHRRGPFGVQQPGRRATRNAGRARRAVVGRGRGVRGPAPRRPHHRAVHDPLPRPVAASGRPPLSLLPAHVPDAGPGRPRPRRPRLGPGRLHRPAGRGGRRALRHGHREQRRQRLRRRRAAPPRLQLLRRPPRRHFHAARSRSARRSSVSASDGWEEEGTPPS